MNTDFQIRYMKKVDTTGWASSHRTTFTENIPIEVSCISSITTSIKTVGMFKGIQLWKNRNCLAILCWSVRIAPFGSLERGRSEF